MSSTPIFEQLCRELVDSGESKQTCTEPAEAGQGATESRIERALEPEAERRVRTEQDPSAEPVTKLEPGELEPGAALEAELGPEAAPESGAAPEPDVAWSPPEERVA